MKNVRFTSRTRKGLALIAAAVGRESAALGGDVDAVVGIARFVGIEITNGKIARGRTRDASDALQALVWLGQASGGGVKPRISIPLCPANTDPAARARAARAYADALKADPDHPGTDRLAADLA